MSLPDIASHEEWLAARRDLLTQEKKLTRARDALSAQRRRLPMVLVQKDYRFEGPDGIVGLLELFEGRRQLIDGHFMFDPEWDDGCPSCSAGAEEMSPGHLSHLDTRDTTFADVSRAPFAKIEDYRQRRGWAVRWYSSYGSDFNYDFHARLDEQIAPAEYNYRSQGEFDSIGPGVQLTGCFSRAQQLPARRPACVSHLLRLRAGPGDDRWLVLHARRDRARSSGGLGGAEGSCRGGARGQA